MPRPLLLLSSLVVVGAGAGLLLHLLSAPQSPPVPAARQAPAPVSAHDGLAELPPPKLPGLDPAVNMEEPPLPGSPEEAQGEIRTLQSQVSYLQEQVDILRKENSALLDKLASITGTAPGNLAPVGVGCDPTMKTDGGLDAPDLVGIGVDLVKIRELADIPLPTLKVKRTEVEKLIADWLKTQFPPDYGAKQGRALAAVGAIPEPVDSIALKAAFLSHQVGGWFDPKSQTLFVAEHASDRENALALAYGYLFKRYGKGLFPAGAEPVTLDRRLAMESLLAGDAALTRFLHAIRHPDKGGGGGVGEDPDDPSRAVPIPNFLRELELLPYGMGLDFMQAMHSIGGWDQVNATYERPPVATAEILDPQVYLAETPFQPLPIVFKEKSVDGLSPVWEDTMGPLGLVLLLKQHVAEPIAAETAPGWANDVWLTYPAKEPGQRDHAVWQTLWKDSNGADAFFSAMRTGLLSRYREARQNTGDKEVFALEGPARHVVMLRTHNGQGVLYIDAAEAGFARAARTRFAPVAKK